MRQGMKNAITLLEFGYSLYGRQLITKDNHLLTGHNKA